MTVRVRPNRLGYLLTAITTFVLGFYFVSSGHSLLSDAQLQEWDSLTLDDSAQMDTDIPLILEESHNKAELQEQGLRITLAQLYENARLNHLGLDEEMGEHEVEGHEEYIYRLSMFVGEYFEGSAAQLYLRKMLSNLNLHISPPLLKTGVRRGVIRILDTGRRGAEVIRGKGAMGGGGVEHGLKRMQAIEREGGWEPNTWDKGGLNRAHGILSRGSDRLGLMWSNMTRPEEQKLVVKYLALMLWGGAYVEGDQKMIPMSDFSEMVELSTSVTPPVIMGPRSSLQPLAPPAPVSPTFIPPSLDPNWTRHGQTSSEKEVGVVLTRSSDWAQGHILASNIIIAKAFHPVFLDMMECIAKRTDLEYIRLKGDGEKWDSAVLNFDDGLLLNEAVDRYLRVQYASSLEELDRVAGDEPVRVGDVHLLPSPEAEIY